MLVYRCIYVCYLLEITLNSKLEQPTKKTVFTHNLHCIEEWKCNFKIEYTPQSIVSNKIC